MNSSQFNLSDFQEEWIKKFYIHSSKIPKNTQESVYFKNYVYGILSNLTSEFKVLIKLIGLDNFKFLIKKFSIDKINLTNFENELPIAFASFVIQDGNLKNEFWVEDVLKIESALGFINRKRHGSSFELKYSVMELSSEEQIGLAKIDIFNFNESKNEFQIFFNTSGEWIQSYFKILDFNEVEITHFINDAEVIDQNRIMTIQL